MLPRFGLGLRGQILSALTVAFVVSFGFLGFAAVQLTHHARASDLVRDAQAAADVMAVAIESSGARRGRSARFSALADAAIGRSGIQGAELDMSGREPLVRGTSGLGQAVEAELGSGGRLRLWVSPPALGRSAPLANLLLLYVAITGGAILLLAYVVLTVLIVRPLEAVTRASERLASGTLEVRVPVRGGAEVARLAVAFNDMASQLRTDRAALVDRLEALERTTTDLAVAEDQVLRAARLAAVGRLAAGVAHEIGNPLSAILGLLELVRNGDVNEDEREEFLRRAVSETERIHSVIRDLLDFARQGAADDGEGQRADLRQVVEDAVRLVTPQKDLRGVTIERRFHEERPFVCGSAERLTQVALNLLLNAADAIGGDGCIEVEVKEAGPGELMFAVTDSGPGIPEAIRDQLFEPFVTTKPAGEGTGLGLAVSHTLVERLGGSIAVVEPEGGGARFEVRLPRAPGDEPAR